MTITTKDIARIAGVSQATVSRSLNNSDLISAETSTRIKKIAAELGFEFNANARSLKTNNTGTVSIVYPENFDDFSFNLYFSSLYNQIRASLEKAELDLIVTFLENRFSGQNSIKKLVSRKKVDGFILVQSELSPETLKFLRTTKTPFVFLHLHPSAYQNQKVDAVYTDHFQGGYLATDHLLRLGRRRISCLAVAGPEDEFKLRTEGFQAAHAAHQVSCDSKQIYFGDRSFHSGYNFVMANRDRIRQTDAIFAQTDLMALGVIEALKELRLKVPENIAIVGYDDIELGTYFKPYLSTIHQPREEIALLTCERLIELLNSKKPKKPAQLAIQPRLVIRESCGAKEGGRGL